MVGKVIKYECKRYNSGNKEKLSGVVIYRINNKEYNYTPLKCKSCKTTNYVALEVDVITSNIEKEDILNAKYDEVKKEIGIRKGEEEKIRKMIKENTKFITKELHSILENEISKIEKIGVIFY